MGSYVVVVCVSLYFCIQIYACVCYIFGFLVCAKTTGVLLAVSFCFSFSLSLFFLWLLLCLAIGRKGEKQDRGFLALDREDRGGGWVRGEGWRNDGRTAG